MKRLLLVTMALTVLSCGLVFGNAITIDDVVGEYGAGTIDSVEINTNIKFWLRYQNTQGLALSIFNGYRIYSPEGATWGGPVQGDSLTGPGAPITKSSGNFDLIFGMNYFDGALADTFVIQGQKVSGPGLPIGYNNIPYGFSIGQFDAAEHGMTICVDSAFGRPASTWKWTGSGGVTVFPAWSGPYCYKIVDPVALSVNERPESGLPTDFSLGQNYPNPFNPVTVIHFDIPVNTYVRLDVYNVLGQRIRTLVDEELPAKKYSVDWDGTTDGGSKVASGIYFYKLEAGSYAETRKMVMLK